MKFIQLLVIKLCQLLENLGISKNTSNYKVYKQINKYLIEARIIMHKIHMTNIASKLKRVWRKMNVCLCVYNLVGMSEEPCFYNLTRHQTIVTPMKTKGGFFCKRVSVWKCMWQVFYASLQMYRITESQNKLIFC